MFKESVHYIIYYLFGPEKGMKIVKKLDYEAIFVDDKGNIVTTEGLRIRN